MTAIAADRLSKIFGGLRAVDEVSLSVANGERRVLILLSKADKLSRLEQKATLARLSSLAPHVRLFSSVTRQGVEECRDLLTDWLQADRGNKRPPVKGI